MFGTNPISKARSEKDGFLVHSIFYTIQGEGPWAGRPTIFVRFAGCNLQCSFCDTEFTEGAQPYTLKELVDTLLGMMAEHRCNSFVLTGGEPMLQPITGLITDNRLFYSCAKFQIETAGTVWPKNFEYVQDYLTNTTIVCSPKTPRLDRRMEISYAYFKYIIKADEVDKVGLPNGVYRPRDEDLAFYVDNNRIYVQSCDEQDADKNAANMAAAVLSSLKHGYRLSIQMHKIAGVP